MFMNTAISRRELIGRTLNTVPLLNKPGTNYSYSNFGYCLLGRVIEKVSDTTYAAFIQQNILAKCGITTMEIGGSTLAEQKANEVYYYDKGEWAYKLNVPRMDSNGGWIATPTDLVKLLVRLNFNPHKPEILKNKTLNRLYTPSLPGSNYAKGWQVNNAENHWHNGSLPGQQSLAVNTATGFSWAVIVNTRAEGSFGSDLDKLMWQIKACIKKWPDTDMF